ncbi:hypothetical protein [Mumia flava]|uniref:hypothetical protein n=1 Tax=Mumia flava TaxID=1348852 RepID=UPI0012FE112D
MKRSSPVSGSLGGVVGSVVAGSVGVGSVAVGVGSVAVGVGSVAVGVGSVAVGSVAVGVGSVGVGSVGVGSVGVGGVSCSGSRTPGDTPYSVSTEPSCQTGADVLVASSAGTRKWTAPFGTDVLDGTQDRLISDPSARTTRTARPPPLLKPFWPVRWTSGASSSSP